MNTVAEEKPSLVFAYDYLSKAYHANFAIMDLLSSSTDNIQSDNLATLLSLVLSTFEDGLFMLDDIMKEK